MNELPMFLYDKLINQYGIGLTEKIINGYKQNRYTTIRINRLKTNIDEVKKILNNNSIKYEGVSWYEDALIIREGEELIRNLDLYNDGFIYLQSLSSMLPVVILNPMEGESILDMAAAPGGKTTQIASHTLDKSLITACEKNKIRADRLKYNISKQGVKKVTILNQDASNLDDFFSFDKILLDSPCSGSGTISLYDNKLSKYFTEDLVKYSIKSQTTLLNKAIKLLKSGHEMVYSTCSILKEENENVVNKFLEESKVEVIPIDEEFFEGLPLLPTTIDGSICVAPNELYEGFFVIKLRKK